MKERNKNKTEYLRFVIGEITNESKKIPTYSEFSESDTIDILKKLKKLAIDNKNDFEVEILNDYLPQPISNGELNDIIEKYIYENKLEGMKNIGRIISYLKEQYNGRFDGSVASKICREYL